MQEKRYLCVTKASCQWQGGPENQQYRLDPKRLRGVEPNNRVHDRVHAQTPAGVSLSYIRDTTVSSEYFTSGRRALPPRIQDAQVFWTASY